MKNEGLREILNLLRVNWTGCKWIFIFILFHKSHRLTEHMQTQRGPWSSHFKLLIHRSVSSLASQIWAITILILVETKCFQIKLKWKQTTNQQMRIQICYGNLSIKLFLKKSILYNMKNNILKYQIWVQIFYYQVWQNLTWNNWMELISLSSASIFCSSLVSETTFTSIYSFLFHLLCHNIQEKFIWNPIETKEVRNGSHKF